MHTDSERFPGFLPEIRGKFWMYPRLMDHYWYQLSGSENKALDFLMRRTLGFEKLSDRISLSQFQKGGGKIGRGTGLSQRQIITAIRGLERKGYITIAKQKGKTNTYSLVMQEVHQSSAKTVPSSGALTVSTTGEEIAHTIDTEIDTKIEKLYSFYKSGVLPTARLSSSDREKMRARLQEFHPREIVKAIRNFAGSDWWMNNQEVPKTIGWFFGSTERIERFLSLDPLPPDDPAYLKTKD